MTMEELDRQVVKLLTISTLIVVVVKVLVWRDASIWLVVPLIGAWLVSLFRLMSVVPQLPYDYFFDRGYGWSLLYAGYWFLVLLPVPVTNAWQIVISAVLVAGAWLYALFRWLRSDPVEYALLAYPVTEGLYDGDGFDLDGDFLADLDSADLDSADLDSAAVDGETPLVHAGLSDAGASGRHAPGDDLDASYSFDDEFSFDDDLTFDDDLSFDETTFDEFALDEFTFDDDTNFTDHESAG